MSVPPSLFRTGSVAALGVGLASFASGLCAGLMPADLQARPDVGPHAFWMALARDPSAHLAFHWTWVAAGLCGLGAVPTVSLLVWRAAPGAVLWSGAAALLGFAVLARSHLMEAAFDRRIIAVYPGADAAFQQAVHVVAGLALDVPDGVLTYGAIGVWIGVVGAVGLRHAVLPRALGILALLLAAVELAGVAGYAFAIRPLVLLAVGGGGALLAPAWWTWVAVLLRRRASAAPAR